MAEKPTSPSKAKNKKPQKDEKTLHNKRHNKLIGAKFVLTPDARFISEVIRSNKRQIELKNSPVKYSKYVGLTVT